MRDKSTATLYSFAVEHHDTKHTIVQAPSCTILQVPGHMFVIGDADCGQFGLGEDEMSAPRPRPTDIAGKQVNVATSQAFLGGAVWAVLPSSDLAAWLIQRSSLVCVWQRLAQSCCDGVCPGQFSCAWPLAEACTAWRPGLTRP